MKDTNKLISCDGNNKTFIIQGENKTLFWPFNKKSDQP